MELGKDNPEEIKNQESQPLQKNESDGKVILPEEIIPIIERTDIPQDVKNTLLSVFEARSWIGPIPPGDELKKYEEACTGAADRVIRMAENNNNANIENNKFTTRSQFKIAKRGQIFALIITLIVIIISGCLIGLGKTLEGTLFGVAGIATIVASFLVATNNKTKP